MSSRTGSSRARDGRSTVRVFVDRPGRILWTTTSELRSRPVVGRPGRGRLTMFLHSAHKHFVLVVDAN